MLHTLVISVTLAIVVSALCSICEAVLYSISSSQVEMLKKEGNPAAGLLYELRSDIEEPITAILTLNTIANTIGAAVAGAAAAKLFGAGSLFLFSGVFTLSILIFSEILPKTIGVTYAHVLAPIVAWPIRSMVVVLKPIVWLCRLLMKILPQRKDESISSEELQTIASLSLESGDIQESEELVIRNILDLKTKIVRDVMTPRTVTFTLDESLSVGDAMEMLTELSSHSRIPVYIDEQDNITGLIMRKDVLQAAAEDKKSMRLAEFRIEVHFVPETARLDTILRDFFDRHQHLFVVVDEYGTMVGVISLEDTIEEIMGREIIDETDENMDMREFARERKEEEQTCLPEES